MHLATDSQLANDMLCAAALTGPGEAGEPLDLDVAVVVSPAVARLVELAGEMQVGCSCTHVLMRMDHVRMHMCAGDSFHTSCARAMAAGQYPAGLSCWLLLSDARIQAPYTSCKMRVRLLVPSPQVPPEALLRLLKPTRRRSSLSVQPPSPGSPGARPGPKRCVAKLKLE